jgi:hypothetical protein
MTKGNRKFTVDGNEVEVIQELERGGVLVAPIWYSGDEEYVDYEHPIVAPRLFDDLPTEKLHVDIARLDAQIVELSNHKRDLARDLKEAEAAHKARLEKYKRYDALKHLDDYLEGKITHYAILPPWGKFEIIPFEGTIEKGDRNRYRPDPPRLLSLFGNTNGDLEWRLCDYADGSGYWIRVVPCLSYEEAQAVVQTELDGVDQIGNDAIEVAKEHGLTIRPELRDAYRAQQISNQEKNVKEYRDRLASAEVMLESLKEGNP